MSGCKLGTDECDWCMMTVKLDPDCEEITALFIWRAAACNQSFPSQLSLSDRGGFLLRESMYEILSRFQIVKCFTLHGSRGKSWQTVLNNQIKDYCSSAASRDTHKNAHTPLHTCPQTHKHAYYLGGLSSPSTGLHPTCSSQLITQQNRCQEQRNDLHCLWGKGRRKGEEGGSRGMKEQ